MAGMIPFMLAMLAWWNLLATAEGNCDISELLAAAGEGNVTQVEELLKCPGIDVNAGAATALYIAAEWVR